VACALAFIVELHTCDVVYHHTPMAAQMSTARAISVILSDSGCADHDGRVVSQLVDFATRYVADVVSAKGGVRARTRRWMMRGVWPKCANVRRSATTMYALH
jgi:hypothetical protein